MLEKFLEKLPSDQNGLAVSTELLAKYTGIVPDELIWLWKTYGLGSFGNQFLWLVNPDDYTSLYDDWKSVLIETNLPIARTSLGHFFFWNTKAGKPYLAYLDIIYNKWDVASESLDFFLESYITDEEYYHIDMMGEQHNANKLKLGAISSDECYGYNPLPALGGAIAVEYAEKVKLREYLSICAQSHL